MAAQEARPATMSAICAKVLNLARSVDFSAFPSMAWSFVRIFALGN
jgi:hypothetical protein